MKGLSKVLWELDQVENSEGNHSIMWGCERHCEDEVPKGRQSVNHVA